MPQLVPMSLAHTARKAVQKRLILISIRLHPGPQRDYRDTFSGAECFDALVRIEKVLRLNSLQKARPHLRVGIHLNAVAQSDHQKLRSMALDLVARHCD